MKDNPVFTLPLFYNLRLIFQSGLCLLWLSGVHVWESELTFNVYDTVEAKLKRRKIHLFCKHHSNVVPLFQTITRENPVTPPRPSGNSFWVWAITMVGNWTYNLHCRVIRLTTLAQRSNSILYAWVNSSYIGCFGIYFGHVECMCGIHTWSHYCLSQKMFFDLLCYHLPKANSETGNAHIVHIV